VEIGTVTDRVDVPLPPVIVVVLNDATRPYVEATR
jgi:hypothetical protein